MWSPESQFNGTVSDKGVDVPACAHCPALYANEVMDGWSASSLPSPLPLRWPVSIAALSRCLPWTLSNIINHWTTHAHEHKVAQRAKEVKGQGWAAVLTPIASQDRVPECTAHARIWKCALRSQKLSLNVYFWDLLDRHIPKMWNFPCNSTLRILHCLFIIAWFQSPLSFLLWSLYKYKLKICPLLKSLLTFSGGALRSEKKKKHLVYLINVLKLCILIYLFFVPKHVLMNPQWDLVWDLVLLKGLTNWLWTSLISICKMTTTTTKISISTQTFEWVMTCRVRVPNTYPTFMLVLLVRLGFCYFFLGWGGLATTKLVAYRQETSFFSPQIINCSSIQPTVWFKHCTFIFNILSFDLQVKLFPQALLMN